MFRTQQNFYKSKKKLKKMNLGKVELEGTNFEVEKQEKAPQPAIQLFEP